MAWRLAGLRRTGASVGGATRRPGFGEEGKRVFAGRVSVAGSAEPPGGVYDGVEERYGHGDVDDRDAEDLGEDFATGRGCDLPGHGSHPFGQRHVYRSLPWCDSVIAFEEPYVRSRRRVSAVDRESGPASVLAHLMPGRRIIIAGSRSAAR
jgi:hypothetical protein